MKSLILRGALLEGILPLGLEVDCVNGDKERFPVLRTDASKGLYGPGHNSFTKDEDGRDICVYHARTEEKIEGNPLYNPNRHAFLMPVKWDESGRPVFSYENAVQGSEGEIE